MRENEHSRSVGELVGSWSLFSGHPTSHKVVGGTQGGAIGCITLEQIRTLGETDSDLALKALKLIGIGATRTEQEESSNHDEPSLATALGGSAKLTEVLYRNKMAAIEAKAKVERDAADEARHDKKRNDILMQRLEKCACPAAARAASRLARAPCSRPIPRSPRRPSGSLVLSPDDTGGTVRVRSLPQEQRRSRGEDRSVGEGAEARAT